MKIEKLKMNKLTNIIGAARDERNSHTGNGTSHKISNNSFLSTKPLNIKTNKIYGYKYNKLKISLRNQFAMVFYIKYVVLTPYFTVSGNLMP